MKSDLRRPIPIYTTRGDLGAFLVYPNIFNLSGEWLGFITSSREVYSIRGDYVGWLSDEHRILRKRSDDFSKPKIEPPPKPGKTFPPASFPLAPLMPEIGFDVIDVLQDDPDRMPTADVGELRPDLD